MMKILRKRERHETVTYYLRYDIVGGSGSLYSFECDKNGNVDESKLNEAGRENLAKCRAGLNHDGKAIVEDDVYKNVHRYVEPAIGECQDCKAEVSLDGFTNTCDGCGADYNMSGQRLASRAQWGEETGESVEDILNIDCRDPEDLLDVRD